MDKSIWRVRSLLANEAMGLFCREVRGLVDRYGFNGAKIYIQGQLAFLRQMREDCDFENYHESEGEDNAV